MMTNHESYAAAIPAALTASVNARLAALAQTNIRVQRIVAATQAEQRVEKTLWLEFFDVVVRAPTARLATEIRAWARNKTLRGVDADYRLPLVRVTTRAGLVRAIRAQKTPSGYPSRAAADSIVTDLESGSTFSRGIQRAHDLSLNLAMYAVWATFRIGTDERGKIPGTAQRLACDLGFDDAAGSGVRYAGDLPLAVLEYEPAAVEAKIPTMIEAWASDPLNYYFSPGPLGQKWGQTVTWPNAVPRSVSRPEVVHAPTPLADLVKKIRMAY
jgi:hypothetical protein